jgi:hypothetical protein
MLYLLITILLLTIFFLTLYKLQVFTVCPICSAVVITWVGGMAALWDKTLGVDPTLVGILMGASLGALADRYGNRLGLLWKTGMVLLGLPAIYYMIHLQFKVGLPLLASLALITLIANRSKTKSPDAQDRFKDCC